MKLSEAIRLGAMLKPQGTNGLLKNGHSCALGAALDALGLLDKYGIGGYLPREVANRWPVLEMVTMNPVTDGVHLSVGDTIVDLNDDYNWTREHIADWVETQERSLEEAADGRDGRRDVSESTITAVCEIA